MRLDKVTVGAGGTVVLPPKYLEALGVAEGGELRLLMEDGELRLFTLDNAIRRAREMVRQHVPEGVSLVDELIAERRAEAARE